MQVHQGNGTASIFEGDDRVVTFDMHGDNNYPWRTRMKSTYDVPLHDDIVCAEASPNHTPHPQALPGCDVAYATSCARQLRCLTRSPV
jgi:hypothetical protein